RPFCGRSLELVRCREAVAQAGPTVAWVWILGEPGIGKTRLAAEVARLAHDDGTVVLFGRNSEDLRVPYQPIIEVIRQAYADGVIEPGPVPEALQPLLPGDVTSSDRRASPGDDEALRYAMFEAVADWFGAAAATRPLLVIVDDVHWAADSTLQLLAHLQRRPDGAPVTFVLTARDTAPDEHPRVAALIAAAQGREATTVVRLEGLSSDEAADLVGPAAGLDMSSIMRQTAGNPLFLQAVDPLDGAVDIESAVRRRLVTLDPRVQDTLRIVSILGLEFDLQVAAAATDRDEFDLLDDLEAAVAARLLDDIGADRFRFAHALVRSSLRSELSSARRARLHGRIARALHEVFADDVGHLPELAFHTAEAAEVDRSLRPVAVERLGRAADEAMGQLSFHEATDLLARARALAPPDDAHQLADLALRHGIAQTRAGKNQTAARTFGEAIELARQTDDVVLRVEAAVRHEDASWRPGNSGIASLGHLAEAREVLDGAVRSGRTLPDELLLRARLAVAQLRALALSGRRSETDVAFEEARELAARLGAPNIEANVLSVYISQVMFYEDFQLAHSMVERLAELEPLIDDNDVALHALHDRILYATLVGRFDVRRELVRTMSDLQRRSHSSFWQFIRANQEAMEAFYEGDLAEAERLAEHCRDLADDLPEEDGSGAFGLRMFMIRREQDRLAAMAPLIRLVVSRAEGAAMWTPGLAMLLAETGATAEAAEVVRPVRDAGFDVPVDALWSTVMVFLAETMVQLGDREGCAVLRERLGSLAGTNVTTGSGLLCFGRAERYLGMLSFALGELDDAEQQLGVALEGDAAGGSVLWSNESRLWLSRVRRAQGHVAEADAMADVVRHEAAAAGLARLVRLAEAELA
ncbi:MAG: AAA family ATPase, partial [Ilumatobacter sp.]|nr:AAA family ATPase [Ilumatobacter sp.]